MIDRARLAHVIPGAAVYFPLARPVDRPQLHALHQALARRASSELDSSLIESHWQRLERRLTGHARWDSVVERPDYPRRGTREQYLAWETTHLTPQNLASRAGYLSPVVDRVQYTFDYFNPANELGMPYREAGEPVLALMMQSTEPSAVSFPCLIRDHMPDSFAGIVRDLFDILAPSGIFGCYSLMSTLSAFLEDRAPPRYSPWDFLFQLHLLKNPPFPINRETRISGRLVGMLPGKEAPFHSVQPYGDSAVLIQIGAGFDAVLRWEYFAIAKALDMFCIQELCEGTIR